MKPKRIRKNKDPERRIPLKPNQKTHRGAAKRFSVTKRGLIKRAKAYKRHILNKKTRKTKRNLRRAAYVSESYAGTIKKLIPYK